MRTLIRAMMRRVLVISVEGVAAHDVRMPLRTLLMRFVTVRYLTGAPKSSHADPFFPVQEEEEVVRLVSKLSAIRTKVSAKDAQESASSPCTALSVCSAMTVSTPVSSPLGILSDSQEVTVHTFGWVPTYPVAYDITLSL